MQIQELVVEISEKAFLDSSINRKLYQLFNRLPKNVELQIVSYKDKQSAKMRSIILVKSSNKNHKKIVNMYLKNIGNINRVIDRRFVNKILLFSKNKIL
jgi:hypothetical protein